MATRHEIFRLDASTIEETPSGGIRLKARLARSGIQAYHQADGSTVREYRPPDEVKASAPTWRGAPLTDLHPSSPDGVTPANYTRLSKGHVGDDVAFDGQYLGAFVYIQDADLIAAVRQGRRVDASGGYSLTIDATPGIDSTTGQRYDRVQRAIRGNHVGLGPPGWGRAGRQVGLQLDAGDEPVYRLDTNDDALHNDEEPNAATPAPPSQEKKMPKHHLKIDGLPFEIEADQACFEALNRRDAAMATLTTERDEFKGEVGQLTKDRDKLKIDLDTANEPSRIDGLVKARSELLEKARILQPEVKVDGRSDRDIMLDALADDDLRVDGISDDEIRGAFKTAAKFKAAAAGQADGLSGAVAAIDAGRRTDAVGGAVAGEKTLDQLEAEATQRRQDAWRQPLAASNQPRN